ncbi:LysE family transporter [Aquimarina sp. 2201CG5-10]|uniref:LysE family transporter n=1 Tax=Aquimarina callyspongiae TaxID=3098150 RepID=UPI002AB4C7D5|nr:LysE family transporter [Aquimarina sp. 2201CG5-10]MDY8134533.1 LysE family transporter [Aquimarina sp. 2201CG5-10]
MKAGFKVFLSGFLISFLGSLPPGILNVTAFQIAASQGVSKALVFACAVVLIELIIVLLILGGIKRFKIKTKNYLYLLLIAVILLFYLAVSKFMELGKPVELKNEHTLFSTIRSSLFLGILLSALNFIQIPFWIGWSNTLIAKNILQNKLISKLLYGSAIAIGTFMALMIFMYSGSHIFQNYYQYNYIITLFLGFTYLGFSIYMIYLFGKQYNKNTKLKYHTNENR